jgi:hypothetical protein
LEAENTALRERLAYYEAVEEEAAAMAATDEIPEGSEQPAYEDSGNGEEAYETYGEETQVEEGEEPPQVEEGEETPAHDKGGVEAY